MPTHDNDKITFGPSSIVGYAAAAAAAIAPLVGELADAAEPLGVPATVWIAVSAGLAVITGLGRMWQAAVKAGRAVTVVDPPVLDFDAPDIGDADPLDPQGFPIRHPQPPDIEATAPTVED